MQNAPPGPAAGSFACSVGEPGEEREQQGGGGGQDDPLAGGGAAGSPDGAHDVVDELLFA